jgi:hypothetical protein
MFGRKIEKTEAELTAAKQELNALSSSLKSAYAAASQVTVTSNNS